MLVGEVVETLTGTDCDEVCGGCVCTVLETLRENKEPETKRIKCREGGGSTKERDVTNNRLSEKACK